MNPRERDEYLFTGPDWFRVEQRQRRSLQSEIESIDGNRLLNTSVDDLCGYFEEKFRIDVPVLHEDRIVVSQEETKIDVSRDPMRLIRDRSRPFYIPGTVVEVTVPFSGDSDAFKIRPKSLRTVLPSGKVNDSSLVIRVAGADLESQQVKAEIDGRLADIKKHLEWLRGNASGFNEKIRQVASEQINRRRQKLLSDQSLVASLGFPLKERTDAPRTYAAPNVRRLITPTMPPASAAPFEPEPTLSNDDYEHILSVMANMTMVMERSPSAFMEMDEETLRTHFLVQLNGHYEGQATGETFNYEGKTDILTRANGKNIFIAECKYWDGAKKFVETIDQLLGYVSWRDTKTAIIIFNRNRNFSQVLGAIPTAVRSHENFKKEVDDDGEGRSRYVFAHRDDRNRELVLTVMAFDVPRSGPKKP